VVFCSDGISEAENEAGELFGYGRTAAAVREGCRAGLSPADLLERLIQEVRNFSGSVSQGDDVTCVVLQIEG
jgi:serine phosphatase RsbU (regulator of sigma subunit)